MRLIELGQLKSQYYEELEKLNKIKKLLDTEQVIEFRELFEINIPNYKSLNELELMKKILANFPTKFTSTNDIYVCVGTYFCKYESAYPTYLQLPPIRSYVKTTYIDSNNYICRNYRNLEDERDFYVYRSEEAWEKHHHLFELSKHTWPTSEFEEKHIVLNPYNSHIEDNAFNEIRAEFFLDCMTMSQEESKQRLVKKYSRM